MCPPLNAKASIYWGGWAGIADGLRPSRRAAVSGWPMAGILPPFLSGRRPQTTPDGGFLIPNS